MVLLERVVNCLQFFIFTRFFAVNRIHSRNCPGLWIAYNFLSLQGSLQCILWIITPLICCELLTIFYLYKVLCSSTSLLNKILSVVNCLQFFIFTRFFAVQKLWVLKHQALWIAYNFLSLQGSLQSWLFIAEIRHCCELLTIFYLYKVLCSF